MNEYLNGLKATSVRTGTFQKKERKFIIARKCGKNETLISFYCWVAYTLFERNEVFRKLFIRIITLHIYLYFRKFPLFGKRRRILVFHLKFLIKKETKISSFAKQ